MQRMTVLQVSHVNSNFDETLTILNRIIDGSTTGLIVNNRRAFSDSSVAVIEAGGFYEQDNSNKSQRFVHL